MSNHSASTSVHRASNSGAPAPSCGKSVADCSKGVSIFTGKPNSQLGDFTGSKSDASPDKATSAAVDSKPTRIPTKAVKSKVPVLSSAKAKAKFGSSVATTAFAQRDSLADGGGEWVSISKEDLEDGKGEVKPDQPQKHGATDQEGMENNSVPGRVWTDQNGPKAFGER